MTKIRLTRRTNALGEREYHYETAAHRYITFRRDEWWVTEIYALERVGVMDPPLMVRGRFVDSLVDVTLKGIREEIALDVEKRS